MIDSIGRWPEWSRHRARGAVALSVSATRGRGHVNLSYDAIVAGRAAGRWSPSAGGDCMRPRRWCDLHPCVTRSVRSLVLGVRSATARARAHGPCSTTSVSPYVRDLACRCHTSASTMQRLGERASRAREDMRMPALCSERPDPDAAYSSTVTRACFANVDRPINVLRRAATRRSAVVRSRCLDLRASRQAAVPTSAEALRRARSRVSYARITKWSASPTSFRRPPTATRSDVAVVATKSLAELTSSRSRARTARP